jgi:hypothetical protein
MPGRRVFVVAGVAVVGVALLGFMLLGGNGSGATGWQAFVSHTTISSQTGQQLLERLGNTDTSDTAAELADIQAVLDWATGENDWLADNPPEDCYASLWNTWHSAMNDYRNAADDAMNGIKGSDATLIHQGVNETNAANDLVLAFSRDTAAAAATCGGR